MREDSLLYKAIKKSQTHTYIIRTSGNNGKVTLIHVFSVMGKNNHRNMYEETTFVSFVLKFLEQESRW